jgi:hypothetical protein
MEIEIEYMEEADDALARNEAIIRKGLIDIGQAFKEIVKWKLYKAKGYKTFNEYCRGEWDYSYPMVACIMKFSETAQGISTIVDISGMRETIIRETLSLPNNETRAEVIKKVLETNPKPTAIGRDITWRRSKGTEDQSESGSIYWNSEEEVR